MDETEENDKQDSSKGGSYYNKFKNMFKWVH